MIVLFLIGKEGIIYVQVDIRGRCRSVSIMPSLINISWICYRFIILKLSRPLIDIPKCHFLQVICLIKLLSTYVSFIIIGSTILNQLIWTAPSAPLIKSPLIKRDDPSMDSNG